MLVHSPENFGDAKMTTHTNMKQIGCLICLAVLLAGCSSYEPPPFEDIDVIIAQRVGPDSIVVERPENNGPFRVRAGGSAVGGVGLEHGGAFGIEGRRHSFQYPAVEGMYYSVTPLIDENGEISLLVTLHPGTPTTETETDGPGELRALPTDVEPEMEEQL